MSATLNKSRKKQSFCFWTNSRG